MTVNMVKCLIKVSADAVKEKDSYGKTPLQLMCENRKAAIDSIKVIAVHNPDPRQLADSHQEGTIFKLINENSHQRKAYEDPPTLYMNLNLGDGWLVEAQMHFRDILRIKKEQHTFYEVKRVTCPWAISDCLFKNPESSEDKLKAKLEGLKHL